jgi:hypothetical protein
MTKLSTNGREKKRARDREAQRQARLRNREYVKELEHNLELASKCNGEQFQSLLAENSTLKKRLERLTLHLETIKKITCTTLNEELETDSICLSMFDPDD